MRSAVLLSWAAASAWANAAWSGVTVSGDGWAFTFSEISQAMDVIRASGRAGANYLVQASSGSYMPFTQAENSTLVWDGSTSVLSVNGDLSTAGTVLFELKYGSSEEKSAGEQVELSTILASGDISIADGTVLALSVPRKLTFKDGDSLTLMATGNGKSIFADLELLRTSLVGLPRLPAGSGWDLRIAPGNLDGYGGDSLVLMAVPMPGPAALFALAAVTGARRRRS